MTSSIADAESDDGWGLVMGEAGKNGSNFRVAESALTFENGANEFSIFCV